MYLLQTVGERHAAPGAPAYRRATQSLHRAGPEYARRPASDARPRAWVQVVTLGARSVSASAR